MSRQRDRVHMADFIIRCHHVRSVAPGLRRRAESHSRHAAFVSALRGQTVVSSVPALRRSPNCNSKLESSRAPSYFETCSLTFPIRCLASSVTYLSCFRPSSP
jgi:hypothetical protein